MDRDQESLSFSSFLQPRTFVNEPQLSAELATFEFRRGNDDKGLDSSRRRCLRQGNERRSADSAIKRVSFREDLPNAKSTALPEKRKGLFGSIFFACRECRAVEPSKGGRGAVVS
ncbi:uncharacterized protein A4U43_C03F12490 [Asparagus officinalis]|uniref:Uncharacterized protein n=1 Tax=Asparagus officinalis TaxID=4686 RepID=A0A5P1FDQ2_ASPOF|nr:uncharacterized protein A4U43_C03F12490 [Asparagus officinalis]